MNEWMNHIKGKCSTTHFKSNNQLQNVLRDTKLRNTARHKSQTHSLFFRRICLDETCRKAFSEFTLGIDGNIEKNRLNAASWAKWKESTEPIAGSALGKNGPAGYLLKSQQRKIEVNTKMTHRDYERSGVTRVQLKPGQLTNSALITIRPT